MNSALVIYAILSGLCAAGWPLFTRGLTSMHPMGGVMVMLGTSFLVYAPLLTREHLYTVWNPRIMIMAFLGGLLNGMANIRLQTILSGPPASVSNAVTIVVVTQLVAISIGSGIFYNEPLDERKVLGIIVVAFGIWLIAGR